MSELKPLPCPFCGGINIINCGLHKYFFDGIRAAERHHGIVGEKGGTT